MERNQMNLFISQLSYGFISQLDKYSHNENFGNYPFELLFVVVLNIRGTY